MLAAFEAAQAAIAPVYTMRELLADPHVRERGVFVEVDGVTMTGPTARLSRTPAHVRHAGPAARRRLRRDRLAAPRLTANPRAALAYRRA